MTFARFTGATQDDGFGLVVGQVYDVAEVSYYGRQGTPMCMVKGLWRMQDSFELVDDVDAMVAPVYNTPDPASPIELTPKETPVPDFKPLDAWSYSRWADYDKCPYYFKKKHIEKIQEPKTPALLKGIAFHDHMADYLKAKPGVTAPPPTQFADLMAELREFPDKIVEEKMGFTHAWKPTGYFAKGDQATWLRATWDVGLLYEDLTGEVCDHKTGKKYGSNMDQMELFALTFFCHYTPAVGVTTRLWYHESGEEEVAEFTPDQVPALKAKWEKRAATMLSDEVLAPKPNDKCRWCMHAKSAGGTCRFG